MLCHQHGLARGCPITVGEQWGNSGNDVPIAWGGHHMILAVQGWTKSPSRVCQRDAQGTEGSRRVLGTPAQGGAACTGYPSAEGRLWAQPCLCTHRQLLLGS